MKIMSTCIILMAFVLATKESRGGPEGRYSLSREPERIKIQIVDAVTGQSIPYALANMRVSVFRVEEGDQLFTVNQELLADVNGYIVLVPEIDFPPETTTLGTLTHYREVPKVERDTLCRTVLAFSAYKSDYWPYDRSLDFSRDQKTWKVPSEIRLRPATEDEQWSQQYLEALGLMSTAPGSYFNRIIGSIQNELRGLLSKTQTARKEKSESRVQQPPERDK